MKQISQSNLAKNTQGFLGSSVLTRILLYALFLLLLIPAVLTNKDLPTISTITSLQNPLPYAVTEVLFLAIYTSGSIYFFLRRYYLLALICTIFALIFFLTIFFTSTANLPAL